MKNRKYAVGYDGKALSLVDPLVGLYWFDAPAFSITPDTHYVGSRQNAVHLITTEQGHVLIDTDFGNGSEYFLLSKVIDLGFNPRDIRFILITHRHPDHVGGARRLMEITGAQVCAHECDAPGVEAGEHPHIMETDGSPWEIAGCPVDVRLRGGETIRVGNKEIQVLHTPGHTSGCLTFVWKTCSDQTEHVAAITGICGVASLAGLLNREKSFPPGETPQDFLSSLRLLEQLDTDIFLGVHQFCNRTWEKQQTLRLRGKRNPFVDPKGWQEWIHKMQKDIESMERGVDIWNGKGWVSDIDFPQGILDPDETMHRGR